MSGAGRMVFQPGAVLTASQVQNYLQDQAVQVYAGTAARGSAIGTATTEGMMSYLADTNTVQMATGTATWVNVDGVPIVAGTATRDALYPSPVPGNIVFRSDSLQRETYYAAAGTPTRSAGWYSGQDGGLVPIIPTSVVVGSGSATVANNGFISFSAVSSISINGAFTSTYNDYFVILNSSFTSSSGDNKFQWRTAGTNQAANYYTAGWTVVYTGTTGTYGNQTNAGFSYLGPMSTSVNSVKMQLSPRSSVCTGRWSSWGVGTGQMTDGGFNTSVASMPDGFTITPTAQKITGNIQIYGYRK